MALFSNLKSGMAQQMGARATQPQAPTKNAFTLTPQQTQAVKGAVSSGLNTAKNWATGFLNKATTAKPFSQTQTATPTMQPFSGGTGLMSSLTGGVSQQMTKTPVQQQNTAQTAQTTANQGQKLTQGASQNAKTSTASSNNATVPITNIDNVNKTYMQGSQMYGLNPQTNRYEAIATPTQTTQQSSPYVSSPTGSGYANAGQAVAQQTQTQPQQDLSYQGLVKELIAKAQMSPEEQAIRQNVGKIKEDLANKSAAELTNPIPLEFQTGRIGVLQNLAQQQIAAQEAQAQTYQQQRQAAIDALQSGVTATAPVQVSPETTLVTPTTGKGVYGLGSEGGNGANAYMKAQAMYQNAQDARAFQGQANQLSVPMKQLDLLVPKMSEFMISAGINPSSAQFTNARVMDYLRQVGGGRAEQYANMVGDLKAYTGAIMGVAGFNPTQTGEITNAMSPENLSPADFNSVMHLVQQLAQLKLQPLQETSTSLYQAGTNPYAGTPATTNVGSFVPAPVSTSALNVTNDPTKQAALSTAGALVGPAGVLGALQGLVGLLKGK